MHCLCMLWSPYIVTSSSRIHFSSFCCCSFILLFLFFPVDLFQLCVSWHLPSIIFCIALFIIFSYIQLVSSWKQRQGIFCIVISFVKDRKAWGEECGFWRRQASLVYILAFHCTSSLNLGKFFPFSLSPFLHCTMRQAVILTSKSGCEDGSKHLQPHLEHNGYLVTVTYPDSHKACRGPLHTDDVPPSQLTDWYRMSSCWLLWLQGTAFLF